MLVPCAVQLRAIHVFLSASAGQKYVEEFLSVGGLRTLTQCIEVDHDTVSDDSLVAMAILQAVADGGRRYKENVCEAGGMTLLRCLRRQPTFTALSVFPFSYISVISVHFAAHFVLFTFLYPVFILSLSLLFLPF